MPQSFITSTSTGFQAFTVPADYVDVGGTVEVIAPGGTGAAGTTGAAGNGGGGGAGGGYAKTGQTNAMGLLAGETVYLGQQAANANVDSFFNPTNLLLQTTAFASSFTTVDLTLTTGVADPFSGTNAANLTPDTVNTFHFARNSTGIKPYSSFFTCFTTFSLYAKPNGYNFLELVIENPGGSNGASVWFNLSTGIISTAAAIFGTYTGPVAGIVSAGGGWYRCWLSAFTDADNTILCTALPCQVTGNDTFVGDGTSGTTVYGWQLNLRNNVPGTFVPTTTVQLFSALAKAGPAGSTTTGGTAPTTGGMGDLVRNGGNGGNSGATRGGGGGGGAAGPTGAGANGGAPSAITTGGGGGGGSNSGSAGASPGTTTGGAGGNGRGGSGGGTGGTVNTGGAATANSGGGGGGGFLSATSGANTTGGAGAGDQIFDSTHGSGGGGGGGGGNSNVAGAPTTSGGAGANYGAGGGGAGYIRNAGTQAGGVGVQGIITLTYSDTLMAQTVM